MMKKTFKMLAVFFLVFVPFFELASSTSHHPAHAEESNNEDDTNSDEELNNEDNDSNADEATEDEDNDSNDEEASDNENNDSNADEASENEEDDANDNEESDDEDNDANDDGNSDNENDDSNAEEESDNEDNNSYADEENDSDEDEESDDNNEEEKVSLMSEDDEEAGDWEEFVDLVEDESVNEIHLTENISNEDEGTVIGDIENGKTIHGDGHTIDMDEDSFVFSGSDDDSTLNLENVTINRNAYKSEFTDAETVEIDNSELNLKNDKRTIFDNVIEFTVKNNSTIDAKTNAKLDSALIDATNGTSEINLESGSMVHLYSEDRRVIETATTDINVKGENTELNIEGETTRTATRSGVVYIDGANSSINVDDGAEINGENPDGSVIVMQSDYGEFIVDHGSELNLKSEGDDGYKRGATLRFRKRGNQTFHARNDSEINIEKTNGDAPAVRMRKDNNAFKASTGSEINIHNEGNGNNKDGGNHQRNQGIYFDKGEGNLFEVNDADSEVNITADYGPAIDLNGNSGEVKINPETVFRAEGATSSSDSGIIAGGDLDIDINSPLYYDFRNNRDGGGEVFETSNATFESQESDLSVWEKGENLDGDPSENWSLFTYTLDGEHFSHIVDSDNEKFKDAYKGADAYSRMSGNNTKPDVDELRIPTNADQSLFGHASVPVAAEDEPRNAWTDEVHVLLEYETPDGKTKEITGSTVGKDKDNDGLAVYGDKPKAGMFQADLSDNDAFDEDDFIEAGSTVKVKEAWRGDKDDPEKGHKMEDPEDVDFVEAIDVTPPDPVEEIIDKDKFGGDEQITNATKRLEGEGTESDAKAYLNVDGEKEKSFDDDVEIEKEEDFTLDLDDYLKKDQKINVLLSDNAEHKTKDEIGYDLPSTHNEDGNINPTEEEVEYHDATFKPASEYQVKDILPEPAIHQEEIAVSDENAPEDEDGNVTRIGSTLEFEFNVENTGVEDSEFNSVTFTDEIPEGLSLDEDSIEINGDSIDKDDVTYDEDERSLEISLDQVSSSENQEINFEADVSESSLEGEEITNKASIKGKTIREKDFKSGDPEKFEKEARESKDAESEEESIPGDKIKKSLGDLTFESAPELLEFEAKISTKSEEFFVNKDKLGKPLKVKDDRFEKSDWKLSAKMKEEFTGEDDSLSEALVYYDENGEEQRLGEDSAVIMEHNYESSDAGDYTEEISEAWEDTDDSKQGLFLQLEPGELKPHDYDAKVEWTLEDAP